MTPARHWEPGVGWIVDSPPRTCQVCGEPIPRRVGLGAPFKYCELHQPARRRYMTRYMRDNAAAIRAYHAARDGSRPTLTTTCADCGKAFRTFSGQPFCVTCRQRTRNRARKTV